MVTEETIKKLLELKLDAMAKALRELLETAPGSGLSLEEQIGLLVDRESLRNERSGWSEYAV